MVNLLEFINQHEEMIKGDKKEKENKVQPFNINDKIDTSSGDSSGFQKPKIDNSLGKNIISKFSTEKLEKLL